jgi:hypothetical protein
MLLVIQDTSCIILYNSLIMYYLAIQGVNKNNKTFYLLVSYTKILVATL